MALNGVPPAIAPRLLILQAYEAPSTPPWIERCLASVKNWAAACGHDYHFTDQFFRAVPDWFRIRCGPEIGPMTDIARLMLMREKFEAGAEWVVWIDADVVIFDPAAFLPAPPDGFFGIREVTAMLDALGAPKIGQPGVNGAVLGARRGDSRFDAYVEAAEASVRAFPGTDIPRTIAGPHLLTRLADQFDFELLNNVGLLTPAMFIDQDGPGDALCRAYMKAAGYPLAAANLCHFLRLEHLENAATLDRLMDAAAAWLIRTRGTALNGMIPMTMPCTP